VAARVVYRAVNPERLVSPLAAGAAPAQLWLLAGVFVGLLGAACVSDVRHRRIPNRLVLALLVLGLAGALLAGGLPGLGRSLLSAAVGLALWLPFHIFGPMGAGDVKLFAAAGAWLAPLQTVDAAFLAAFAGGALSLLWLLRDSGLRFGIARALHAARWRRELVTDGGSARRKLPYGLAMAVGLSLSFFGVGFLGR
jgi:prepilin peptidase CpaA